MDFLMGNSFSNDLHINAAAARERLPKTNWQRFKIDDLNFMKAIQGAYKSIRFAMESKQGGAYVYIPSTYQTGLTSDPVKIMNRIINQLKDVDKYEVYPWKHNVILVLWDSKWVKWANTGPDEFWSHMNRNGSLKVGDLSNAVPQEMGKNSQKSHVESKKKVNNTNNLRQNTKTKAKNNKEEKKINPVNKKDIKKFPKLRLHSAPVSSIKEENGIIYI